MCRSFCLQVTLRLPKGLSVSDNVPQVRAYRSTMYIAISHTK